MIGWWSPAASPVREPVAATELRAPAGTLAGEVLPDAQETRLAAVESPAPVARRRWVPYALAYAAYQALALAAWWHLLASGFANALPSGSADPGEEVWFLAWLPHALGDGVNPFFSHVVFAPSGVNLLSNTSLDLLGLVFAPVTLAAGPVATLDAASILAPALSALAAFALCRRYVRWQPAAFVGGLCYGFGPFLATDLRYAHLDLTWLVLPPLILLMVDELFVRHRWRPVRAGEVLGALVVAQFFVSTELLAVSALTAALALAVVAAARPASVGHHVRAAGRGIAATVAVAVALLAYPMWVVVAGPRHVVGPVWPSVGQISATLASTVQPHGELAGVAFVSGGNGSYLGVGLLAVLVAGAVAYRRSTRLRLALALMVLALLASLGYDLHAGTSNLHVPLPTAVLGHVPLLDSLVPERFGVMVDLFAGAALAIVLDHLVRRRGPAVAALAAAVALVPLALVPSWPYATTTLRQPPALASGLTGAPRLAVYPDGPGAAAQEMVWQAQDGFAFSLADGYAIVPGPGGRAVEQPRTDALWLVFAAGSVHRLRLPLTGQTVRSVRAAVRHDGIDDVIVLPGAAGSAVVRTAMASVFGPPARVGGGAAMWVTGRVGRAVHAVRRGRVDDVTMP